MLTPRHEALLATLLGMTVGVSAFGIYVAVRDAPLTGGTPQIVATTPTQKPSPHPSAGALDGTALTFVTKALGFGGQASVPSDWAQEELAGDQTRFMHSSSVWLVRFENTSSKRDPERHVRDRARKVRNEQNLRIVSEDTTTLVYTYTRDKQGRMVLSRWIAAADGEGTAAEITVAGRPQDAAGLAVVLAKATESYQPTASSGQPR
ncbi:hypothetical protein OG394_22955 [Kribbella sp. NBC_01245]|uniref:hypothetical protein n=1 Tax=Kribbella sp. NBC_01245 TaxID=2903578 RepID=UPI002E2BDAFE|nr:hypothetical protein [Kribbella sp. NBC_01245]